MKVMTPKIEKHLREEGWPLGDIRALSLEERRQRGRWVPACDGSELPSRTRSGLVVLYCWNTGTGEHAWLDVASDIILTPAEAEAAHGWRY